MLINEFRKILGFKITFKENVIIDWQDIDYDMRSAEYLSYDIHNEEKYKKILEDLENFFVLSMTANGTGPSKLLISDSKILEEIIPLEITFNIAANLINNDKYPIEEIARLLFCSDQFDIINKYPNYMGNIQFDKYGYKENEAKKQIDLDNHKKCVFYSPFDLEKYNSTQFESDD